MAARRDAENAPDGMSDEDAADLLRRSHKMRDLRRAYESVVEEGLYRDLSMQNYVYRVLHLAVTGDAIQRPSPEDLARFDAVDDFAELPPEAAWAELTERLPELADLERMVRDGGDLRSADDRITGLRGAEAATTDPIVRLHYAKEFARNWLQRTTRI